MLPMTVKGVQDAVAFATAARTFDPTPDGDHTLVELIEGRSSEAIVRSMLVLARMVAKAYPADMIRAMAEEHADLDRKAMVLV